MKTKSEVSQRVEINTTPHYLVGLVLSGIPSAMTLDGDWVADMDTEHDEKMIQLQLEEPKGIREGGCKEACISCWWDSYYSAS